MLRACESITAPAVLIAAIGLAPADAVARRDPLRPPERLVAPVEVEGAGEAESFDASAWMLTSTLISADRRVAVVNGRAVRTGERVAGATVLGIESGRVRLEIDGRRFTVERAMIPVRVERGAAK